MVRTPGADVADRHSWMGFSLMFDDAARKNEAVRLLEEAGIETRPIIVGNIARHPVASFFSRSSSEVALPGCDAVFRRGMLIGLNPTAPPEDEAFLREMLGGVLERLG